jgi:hypothetical protein
MARRVGSAKAARVTSTEFMAGLDAEGLGAEGLDAEGLDAEGLDAEGSMLRGSMLRGSMLRGSMLRGSMGFYGSGSFLLDALVCPTLFAARRSKDKEKRI